MTDDHTPDTSWSHGPDGQDRGYSKTDKQWFVIFICGLVIASVLPLTMLVWDLVDDLTASSGMSGSDDLVSPRALVTVLVLHLPVLVVAVMVVVVARSIRRERGVGRWVWFVDRIGIGGGVPPMIRSLGWWTAASLMSFTVAGFIAAAGGGGSWQGSGVTWSAGDVALIGVTAGLTEELVNLVVLVGAPLFMLSVLGFDRWSPRLKIGSVGVLVLASGLLRGVRHIAEYSELWVWINIGLGVVLAGVFVLTRSIWPVVVAHIVYDVCALCLSAIDMLMVISVAVTVVFIGVEAVDVCGRLRPGVGDKEVDRSV